MSYQKAMEAAGATVVAYEAFGSYQGEWYAKVVVNGVTGFVSGYYGSCSGCDAFESEFGYSEPKCEEHEYTYDKEATDDCAGCKVAEADYAVKLAAFGQSYLDGLMTYEEALAQASKNSSWDMEADEMVKWVKENA